MLLVLYFLFAACLSCAVALSLLRAHDCQVDCEWVPSSASLKNAIRYSKALHKERSFIANDSAPDEGIGYNPSFNHWDLPQVRLRNNCYNFATDHVTNTYAKPGYGTGYSLEFFNRCDEMEKALISDGLVPVQESELGNYKGSFKSCHYIASVLTAANATFKDQDYHFYRLMKPGYDEVETPEWWHKTGTSVIRRVDFSGKKITNVKTANRGPYTQFCGYFKACIQIA